MSNTAKYSHPDVKKALQQRLLQALYQSWYNELSARLKELIRDNSRAHGNTQLCVRLDGEILEGRNYHPKQLPRPINGVHRELRSRFREWQQNKDTMEREIHTVRNFLATLFTQLHHPDDHLKVLPDSLHPTVEKYRQYFSPDAPVVSSETLQAFCQTNEPYRLLIKKRMARNLLQQH